MYKYVAQEQKKQERRHRYDGPTLSKIYFYFIHLFAIALALMPMAES